MSTIWIAAILIAITVIPSFIFIRLHKRQEKKRREELLTHFKKAGVKHSLFFTHQEMLKDKMLGLDAHNQKLLMFAFDGAYSETVIDLAALKTCTVHKEYENIIISDKKSAKADRVLIRMGLKIEFSNNAHSLLIDFYDNHLNGIYEMPELEKKANEWGDLIVQEATRKKRKLA